MHIVDTTQELRLFVNSKTLAGTMSIERVTKLFGIEVRSTVTDAEHVPSWAIAEILRTGKSTWNSRLEQSEVDVIHPVHFIA